MWATFFAEDNTESHAVPCDDDGAILNPHSLSNMCKCRPEIERLVRGDMIFEVIIHNEIH